MKYLSSHAFLAAVVFSLTLSATAIVLASSRRSVRVADATYRQYVCTGSLIRNLASLAETSPAVVNLLRSESRSLASVAASLGVDPDVVVAITLRRLGDRLQLLVGRGKCSPAHAERLVRRAGVRLLKLMMAMPEPGRSIGAPVVITRSGAHV